MKILRLPMILLLTVMTFSACASQRGNVEPGTVDACTAPTNTAQGAFAGERSDDGTCSWKGIPFASSGPEYRFRKPGPPPTMKEVRMADAYGPACNSPVLNFLAPGGIAEDCLNLNIWASETVKPGDVDGRPVMVFFYGGAFVLGSGSWMVYDGAELAKNGVIVITINYRMGPLGFYASSAQRAENKDGAAGNWGIWDQIAALQWVRDNIQAFGGNPKNITIFGESAGGYSVCTLLASPAAARLFDRAIMQSGGCLVHTLDQQLQAGKELVARTPCADAEDEMTCLRNLDAEEFNVWQRMWRGSAPTVDGVLLLEQPLEALRNGHGNPVPLLVGANRDELRPLALVPPIAWNLSESRESFWAALGNAIGDEAPLLRTLYPDRKNKGTREIWVDMMDDVFFRCSVVNAAEAQAKFAPVFAYEFDIGKRETWSEKQMGAYHSIDIPYIFGFHGWPRVMNGGVDILERTAAYSRRIQAYWTHFARAGNPNSEGRSRTPIWQPYAPHRTITRLAPKGTQPMPGYLQKQCAYWNSKGYATLPDQAAFMGRFSSQAGVPLGASFDVE